jgi:hypothetical protein
LARSIELVWWVGRQRLGLSMPDSTAMRVERFWDIDGWLIAHAAELDLGGVHSSLVAVVPL